MSQSNPETLDLRLSDQQPSGFIKEGMEDNPMAKDYQLSAPSWRRIPSNSVMIDKSGKRVKIRYIQGCDEILVTEQEKNGFKPNPRTDIIAFENGQLIVSNDGLNIGLYNYLKACEFNGSNDKRPKTATVKFVEHRPEVKARSRIKMMDAKMEAMKMVQSLYDRSPSGKMSFDEKKVDFLCHLFDINLSMKPEEKIEILMDKANEDPQKFIDSVLNKQAEIKVVLSDALRHNVIFIQKEHASFANGRDFYTFENEGKDERLEELCNFLLSDLGDNIWKEINIELEAAKKKQQELD